MTIKEVKSTEILQDIVLGYLSAGTIPTVEQVAEDFEARTAGTLLEDPVFEAVDFQVDRGARGSAALYNSSNQTIQKDMDILLRSTYQSVRQSTRLFDRWTSKLEKLENRATKLEARINRILDITQDTSGYFSAVGDKFSDARLIDLDLSSNLDVNLAQNIVVLSKSAGSSVTRVFLNDLERSQVRFNLISSGALTVGQETNTHPMYALQDYTRFWKTTVFTQQEISPLLGELDIRLEEPISFSKIDIRLHSSNLNSATKIIPMYSSDGINYRRVPAVNTVVETFDKAEFNFPAITGQYFKILFEKSAHDFRSSVYQYEFGAKEIAFFNDAYSSDASFRGTLVSKPLSITKLDNSLLKFNRVSLEVCEAISSQSFINYFVAVAQDDNGEASWLTADGFTTDYLVDGEDTRLWTPISPLNREEALYPRQIDFTSLDTITREGIGISYDAAGSTFKSPAENFTVLQEDTGVVYNSATNGSELRYYLVNSQQQILDLQLDSSVDISLETLRLWRNVGSKNIDPSDVTERVRGIQKGWEFSDPYYSTTVLVNNSNGFSIDTGENPITIDGKIYRGVISREVLSKGTHRIQVHKDYWRQIDNTPTTLAELKALDVLYPFNQKLLIEGFDYPEEWTDEKRYVGVDRFAGYLMDRVSAFDMVNNVPAGDLRKYALDTDAPSTATFDSDSSSVPDTKVFVVNVDLSKGDFVQEDFVLEFNLASQFYEYIAFRAELWTQNSTITPALDEYKIKLGV